MWSLWAHLRYVAVQGKMSRSEEAPKEKQMTKPTDIARLRELLRKAIEVIKHYNDNETVAGQAWDFLYELEESGELEMLD